MSSRLTLVFAIGVTVGALFGLPGLVVFPASVAVITVLAREHFGWLVLAAILGTGLGTGRDVFENSRPLDPNLTGSLELEGVVESLPKIGPSGLRASVTVERMRKSDGGWSESQGMLLIFFGESSPQGVNRNDLVRVHASVDGPAELDPDFSRFVRSEGARGVGWAHATSVIEHSADMMNPLGRMRDLITRRILEAVPGDSGALLAGFVTGDDSALSEPAREAFDRTNTSHITAVSGANIAILITMWTTLAPSRRFRRHMLVQIALLAIIWSYVGLIGFGPAALRAAVFASLMIPAARFGRKPDALTSLMIASALLLLLIPEMADSVGFWLSMAASAALVTAAPLRNLGEAMTIRWMLVSLVAAQFATLPITFWVFGQWSPASFLANLMIGPVVSVIFPLAFAFAAMVLISPLFGPAIGWLPGIGAQIIIATVESLGATFSMMRSGSLSGTGALLIAILSGSVIACLSVDVQRWIRRIEFTYRKVPGLVPAGVVGAIAGLAMGLIVASLV